ncbi:MAG: ImmA/IrrE family metallo-endopeptidase [Melioribacteraceae bacterium]|nr:ImmA/IrrE family metallo-endopeptidase [Melioribacteraceae bacterium]
MEVIKLIKTEKEYEAALEEVERLIDIDPKLGTNNYDKLELLSHLISEYEDEHYPIDLPDPIEAIKFRMDQQNLTQKDLIPYIGSASKVSELLNKKRPLSLNMIRALHKGLGIPAEVLLQEKDEELLENPNDINYDKFPVKEIYKRGWLNNYNGTLTEAKQNPEEVLRKYFIKETAYNYSFNRKNSRLKNSDDKYAMIAWTNAVKNEAAKQKLAVTFKQSKITKEFLNDVVKLSYLDNGPDLAGEYLVKNGIHFVILPHLPKTHLDGAVMPLADGTPIIALTLRYDRLDYFWFTLAHELAHLYLHYNNKNEFFFFDDLEINDNLERAEKEADKLAEEILIPNSQWEKIIKNEIPSKEMILEFADKLRISPAIIAGRIRKHKNNYRLYSGLVGHGEVKKLLE